MKCKICKSDSHKLFSAKLLRKHTVEYFQCPQCDFIQTEDPHWLEEAYSSAISDLDVGLVARNVNLSTLVGPVLEECWGRESKYLDHGGGYGLFVRLMRDRGFNFYRQDQYCENIFARGFDIEDVQPDTEFALVTAFEVFEHLVNPIEEITKMFSKADSILFSTHLQPNKAFNSIEDWWYFVPDSGQHISFYSRRTLEFIANLLGKKLYSNSTIHLMCHPDITPSQFDLKMPPRLEGSLLPSDAAKVKANLLAKA